MLKLIIKGITVTQEGTPWVTALVVYCVVLNTEFGKPCDSLIWFYFQTFVNIYFLHILNTLLLPDTVMKMTAGDRWKPVRD